MGMLAGPGDTGDTGSAAILVLIGLVATTAILIDRAYQIRRPQGATRRPDTAELAYLNGGAPTAIHATLAGLWVAGAVTVIPRRRLTVIGHLPAGASPLDRAVYAAAGRQAQIHRLHLDHDIAAAAERVRAGLINAGWALDRRQRARARVGGFLLLGLGALGVARFIAATPADAVTPLTVAIVIAGLLLLRAPRCSSAGSAALTKARRTCDYLAPKNSPSWAIYGPDGAAMGVALFGTEAWWAADPAFAEAAGLPRPVLLGRSGADRSSSGGGGGCGGAGCGGGGGDGGG